MPFIELKSLPEREPAPGMKAVCVHSDSMTLAYWEIEEGAVLPEHSHPHEQIATVVEGQFELTVAGEAEILDRGSVAVIPPNSTHSGKAITKCRVIDAFHPVREDYR